MYLIQNVGSKFTLRHNVYGIYDSVKWQVDPKWRYLGLYFSGICINWGPRHNGVKVEGGKLSKYHEDKTRGKLYLEDRVQTSS